MVSARFLAKAGTLLHVRSRLVRECLAESLAVFVQMVSAMGERLGPSEGSPGLVMGITKQAGGAGRAGGSRLELRGTSNAEIHRLLPQEAVMQVMWGWRGGMGCGSPSPTTRCGWGLDRKELDPRTAAGSQQPTQASHAAPVGCLASACLSSSSWRA